MYWSRTGDVPFKLAIQKLCAGNATALNPLCEDKIIEIIDSNIYIKFLSEQLNEFEDTSKQNSKNAKEGWVKRRKQREESERNATALNPQCENDAIREEKRREEKIKEEKIKEEKRVNKFTPPTILEVEVYFVENGYSKQSGAKAFNYYNVADWKDSNGKQVRNWKQKMQSVWFKDENKINVKPFFDSPA
jgi:hypothetical protein